MGVSRAVSIMIGTLTPVERSFLRTPTPSSPGSMMSNTITSGLNFGTSSSPEIPSWQQRTEKPLCSSCSCTTRAMERSSSTIRTRVPGFM